MCNSVLFSCFYVSTISVLHFAFSSAPRHLCKEVKVANGASFDDAVSQSTRQYVGMRMTLVVVVLVVSVVLCWGQETANETRKFEHGVVTSPACRSPSSPDGTCTRSRGFLFTAEVVMPREVVEHAGLKYKN
jgi:hypothetical protein